MFYYLILFISLEVILFLLVLYLRKDFQWLITKKDRFIKIDENLAIKFFENSFHSQLGWMRKANSVFSDETENGLVTYTIDNNGLRKNDLFNGSNFTVSSYGDSFCFGRLVNDNETWQYMLSKKLKVNVSNGGVGNYGLDQALLRFENDVVTDPSKFVIVNVVPETICRVHSVWKHYFEYGNTLAFKPVFKVIGEKLILNECPIKSMDDLIQTASKPAKITENDYFYKNKFLKDMIYFPFCLTILKRPIRNTFLIILIIIDKFNEIVSSRKSNFGFKYILYQNKNWSDKLFESKSAKKLLYLLLRRFASCAIKNNKKPILLWTPQQVDLNEKSIHLHQKFLSSINDIPITIIDMTHEFMTNKDSVYVTGSLGPHPSKIGNNLIADKVYSYFSSKHENYLQVQE